VLELDFLSPADVWDVVKVAPAFIYSPRHGMPFNSISSGSKCVG